MPRGLKPLPAFPEAGEATSTSEAVYTPRPSREEAKKLAAEEQEKEKDLAESYAAASGPSAASASTRGPAPFPVGSKYIHSGLSSSKRVALTFDDGPNPKYTPQLLSYLRENHVPATFFLLGENVASNATLLIEMSEFGFEIGNHSWNHPELGKAAESKIRMQLENTNDVIEQATGKRPALFRPPYGSVGKTLREVCESMGLDIIIWSVDSEDWRSGMTADRIVANVEKELRGGAIILMHDRLSRTIEAVPRVVDLVRSKGYELTTVSELLRELRGTEAPASEPEAPEEPVALPSQEGPTGEE